MKELITPYEIKSMNDEAIKEEAEKIQALYNPCAISPYQLSENIDVIARMIQLFTYMAAKCKSEYAIKDLECKYAENNALKELRQAWNKDVQGTPPAIDYFKACAANQVKEQRQEADRLETLSMNFKAAADSYKERIAAIKYKINAIAIEEGRKNGV